MDDKMKYFGLLTTLLFLCQVSCDSSPDFTDRSVGGLGPVKSSEASSSTEEEKRLDTTYKGYEANWTFESSDIEEIRFEYDTERKRFVQRESMALETSPVNFEFFQAPLSIEKTDVFKQGTDRKFHRDFFKQNEHDDIQGLLDILVVVDNSGSMEEEQRNLASKLMPLLSYVEESDWQIAITTTDLNEPSCLRGLVRKGQENAEASYMRAIQAGISGSGLEAGVPRAVQALSSRCANGWLRPQSTLAVLIVSDEDNCSDGRMCQPSYFNSADYLYNVLSRIRQPGVDAKVFGLIWHPSQSSIDCQTGYRRAHVYSELIQSTQGRWGSICDDDYSKTLEAMSLDMSLILKPQFALTYKPIQQSIQVLMNDRPQVLGRDYRLLDNVIEFNQSPPAGARILVSYVHEELDLQKDFVLSANGDVEDLVVYLDGREVTNYTFDQTIRQVSFDRAPRGSEIKAVYKVKKPVEPSFKLDSNLIPSSISVEVDRIRILDDMFTYDAVTGVLNIHQSLSVGSQIYVKGLKPLAQKLSFKVLSDDVAEGSIEVRTSDNHDIGFTYRNGVVYLDVLSFAINEDLFISWNAKNNQTLTLSDDALLSSIEIVSQDGLKCGGEEVVVDRLLVLQGCGFDILGVVSIKYNRLVNHRNTFELNDEKTPASFFNSFEYEVRVWVSGRQVFDFNIKNRVLSFEREIEPGSRVKVQLRKLL